MREKERKGGRETEKGREYNKVFCGAITQIGY
jgi:hypothetical protein